MVEEDLAFRTFDAASAGLDAVRRRAGGGSADGPGLPGTRNERRFGLDRRPSGGCRMRDARGLLISITGGYGLTLYEVDEAASRIRQEVDDEANIILGATFEPALEEAVRVSVVATGIDQAANLQIDGMSARNLTQKVLPFPRVA